MLSSQKCALLEWIARERGCVDAAPAEPGRNWKGPTDMARIIGGIGASHTPTIGFAKDNKSPDDPDWADVFRMFDPVKDWLRDKNGMLSLTSDCRLLSCIICASTTASIRSQPGSACSGAVQPLANRWCRHLTYSDLRGLCNFRRSLRLLWAVGWALWS